MTKITRRFVFDAGHRIYGHESKCNNLHGHRYEVDVSVQGSYLDDLGRVVDFGVLKSVLGNWIDENLDHRMILQDKDPFVEAYNKGLFWKVEGDNLGRNPFIMTAPPTAENIAALIYTAACLLFANRVDQFIVTEVTVYETEKSSALYNGPTQLDLADYNLKIKD